MKNEVIFTEYQELKKLYYKNSDVYIPEYLKRFNSEECVKIKFNIHNNQAFFMENRQVLSKAYQIAKLDKKLKVLCDILPGVAIQQYSRKCLIDEIVLTNKIEGVRSSRKEIGEALNVLEQQSKNKENNRFLGLVNKYFKLINCENIKINCCSDIRKIYDEVFLNEIILEDGNNLPDGEIFRKGPVSVHTETDKIIHSGLMPETKIIEAMEQAIEFLNDDSVDQLFRICIFHYLFEYIHPFYDGNGRFGRFILSYGISNELTPLVAFRISETIKENIGKYYKAFKNCNDFHNLGDLTPFLLMQLDMILIAMQELEKSLQNKLNIWNKYELMIKKNCDDKDLQNLYSLLIQASLFSEEGISMSELQTSMDKSRYIINKLIVKIPEKILVVNKKSKFKYYLLNLDMLDYNNISETIKKFSDSK